jgi:hypothetical protein
MEKKRTWKFNIVDAVVILLVLAALAFLAMKILSPANKNEPERPGVMEYVVEVKGLQKTVYDSIAAMIPCQMAASGKWVDGSYIESVECEPCSVESFEAANPVNGHLKPTVFPGDEEEFVNAYFYCTADVDLNNLFNVVGTQEVRVGRSHFVKSVDFEVVGTILSVNKYEK